MNFFETTLSGVFTIRPEVKRDHRGFFMEILHKDELARYGWTTEILQVNQSYSKERILRGLHLQWEKPLAKLIRVIQGRAFVVAVDARKNSATVGKWVGKEMSASIPEVLAVPAGFASGFCVIGKEAGVEYYYSAIYNQYNECSIGWNDSLIGITWPILNPIISPRDQAAITFTEWLSRRESESF